MPSTIEQRDLATKTASKLVALRNQALAIATTYNNQKDDFVDAALLTRVQNSFSQIRADLNVMLANQTAIEAAVVADNMLLTSFQSKYVELDGVCDDVEAATAGTIDTVLANIVADLS